MSELEGDQLVQEAEELSNSFFSTLFANIFGVSMNYTNALELYEKAAAQYKMNKQWCKAGRAMLACVDISKKIGKDVSSYYVKAGQVFMHCDLNEAVRVFSLAAEMRKEENEFRRAASVYKELALCYERLYNFQDAMNAWKDAEECYVIENLTYGVNECQSKVQELQRHIA
jgi:tetratricopeptide (TPR) repeat protein